MDAIDRRAALGLGIAAGAASLGGPVAAQAPANPAPAFTPRPLPFDAATLPGLSAKLLTSHHDNNYIGAVKRLGAIKAEFARLDPMTAPGFTLNGLKREELIAWNSMILHEIYFAGLGGASRPGARLSQAIERDFGSHARWAAEFTGMGKALAEAVLAALGPLREFIARAVEQRALRPDTDPVAVHDRSRELVERLSRALRTTGLSGLVGALPGPVQIITMWLRG